MNKEEVRKELEQRQVQLNALISFLENQGKNNPQYNQILICEKELKEIDSQLERLSKLK